MKNTKVAVIGLGNIGVAIATNLTKGNHEVLIASRDVQKTQELAKQLGSRAKAVDIEAAIEAADVVIPAIYFQSLQEFFKTYAKQLAGKVVVDVSNPIAPDGKGGFKKIIGEKESSGEILSGLLPSNARLVKAFGSLGAGSLVNDAFANERKVLFYATDHSVDRTTIETIISASGFAPVHVGGMDQSIRIEVFGDLHQFGGLGKTMTVAEAEKQLYSQAG